MINALIFAGFLSSHRHTLTCPGDSGSLPPIAFLCLGILKEQCGARGSRHWWCLRLQFLSQLQQKEMSWVQETSSVCWWSSFGRESLGPTYVGLCRQEIPGLGACRGLVMEVSEVGLHTLW